MKMEAFKDWKSISGIRGNHKRHNITSMTDHTGKIRDSRQGIVDAFAHFYEELYGSRTAFVFNDSRQTAAEDLSEITDGEIQTALKKMAKNRSGDRTGMVAEMLQEGSQQLRTVIAYMFTLVLRGEWVAPSAWKTSYVMVLYKKGDPKLPGNYRPITLLPILYKLFSRILLRQNWRGFGCITVCRPGRISQWVFL